jgi:16S rRNA (adenine1518-N6/adenine1519-N6)-dimethyltransferase
LDGKPLVVAPKKSLGQHWLRDREVLEYIARAAELTKDDTVLEIGPGLGTLTSELLRQAGQVTAVEFDGALAKLPAGYKVAANVPYYITSKIVQLLMTAMNKPSITVLLVQKEVAERLAARPGDMSILAVSAQVFAEVEMGDIVPAELFTPPPKVDSAVVILRTRTTSLLEGVDEKAFFRMVKAGFSAKRKKLRSSLAGGLGIDKRAAETLLAAANISPELRAEDLSIDDWLRLTKAV